MNNNKVGTTFTSAEQTTQGVLENGMPGLPYWSEEGRKLAEKTAPASAFVLDGKGKIGTSAVDKLVR
jgi:hypothetical protein